MDKDMDIEIQVTLHAAKRAEQREVPDEILNAMKSAPRFRVYADYGGEADAAIVRGDKHFWIAIMRGNVMLTIYSVAESRIDGWAWERLRNISALSVIRKLVPVLTNDEVTTQEVSRLWLKC